MKKNIVLSALFFLGGTVFTGLLLVNPFGWHWVHRLQESALSAPIFSPGPTATHSLGLWTCGMHPQVLEEEPGFCPICQMTLVTAHAATRAQTTPSSLPSEQKSIRYWQAPMDPSYISDKPGKSPMGMDLIPVYEDEPLPPGMVSINPVFVQNMGVQSTKVTRANIPLDIQTVGTLTYDDSQLFSVNTKYAGWIEKAYVHYLGESVEKGQKLFEIYSPQLLTTQKEYLQALDYAERLSQSTYPNIAARARSLVDSARQRLRFWDITKAQILELEQSRQPLRTLTVFSPVSGLLFEKIDQAVEGLHVRPGMNIYKIVNLSTIWLEAEVFEHQIPRLRVGQQALVEVPSQPGRQYRATVQFISPFFNNQTHTLRISMKIANPDQALKADMYAHVNFSIPSGRDLLAVPEEAVIHSGKRNIVVLDRGNGTFQVKEVILGVTGNGLWEVKKGLNGGERVVVSSQFLIDSESRLREAIHKMVSNNGESAEPETQTP